MLGRALHRYCSYQSPKEFEELHLPVKLPSGEIQFHWFSKKKFDSARLVNENFTAFISCMNNFCCGTKYTETKINSKRLHRCWREGDKSWKTERWKFNAEQTCWSWAVFINWKKTWSEWRTSNRAIRKRLVNFSSEPTSTFMNWRLFLPDVSVVFWTKYAGRSAGNLESGIFASDKQRRFHRLNEGEYFYGTQEFCWEIKVNLVAGSANILHMWEQMTEAMCCN